MEVRPLLKQRSGVTAGCFRIAGFTALKRHFFKRKNNKMAYSRIYECDWVKGKSSALQASR